MNTHQILSLKPPIKMNKLSYIALALLMFACDTNTPNTERDFTLIIDSETKIVCDSFTMVDCKTAIAWKNGKKINLFAKSSINPSNQKWNF